MPSHLVSMYMPVLIVYSLCWFGRHLGEECGAGQVQHVFRHFEMLCNGCMDAVFNITKRN